MKPAGILHSLDPMAEDAQGQTARRWVDLAIPKLNQTHDYLRPDGSYLLMLGVDLQARRIVPVGVGQIKNLRAVSVGPQHYQALDVLSFALLPAAAQTRLQAYVGKLWHKLWGHNT